MQLYRSQRDHRLRLARTVAREASGAIAAMLVLNLSAKLVWRERTIQAESTDFDSLEQIRIQCTHQIAVMASKCGPPSSKRRMSLKKNCLHGLVDVPGFIWVARICGP